MNRLTRTLTTIAATAALACLPTLAQATPATPSTEFTQPTRTFTLGDDPWVGPYGNVMWTLSPTQSGGAYDPANMSVENGALRYRLHDHTGAYAAFDAMMTGQTYGTWTVKVTVKGTGKGWGSAFILWPTDDHMGEGEVDFAEGPLNGNIHTYVHHVGDCGPDGYCGVDDSQKVDTHRSWRGTHTLTVTWTPGVLDIKVDGHRSLRTTADVPTTPHRLVIQAGSNNDNPSDSDMLIDYVRYTRAA